MHYRKIVKKKALTVHIGPETMQRRTKYTSTYNARNQLMHGIFWIFLLFFFFFRKFPQTQVCTVERHILYTIACESSTWFCNYLFSMRFFSSAFPNSSVKRNICTCFFFLSYCSFFFLYRSREKISQFAKAQQQQFIYIFHSILFLWIKKKK